MKKHENAKELNELELKEVTGGHNATPRIIPGYKNLISRCLKKILALSLHLSMDGMARDLPV